MQALEDEAIAIMREVAAQFRRPVVMFSGGKDSVVLLRLAEKAFRPGRFPFPVLHVDTGHNFPEVLEFRDRRLDELDEELIVASVPEAIAAGRVTEDEPGGSRNRLQSRVLLDAIEEHGFDAAIGGARRDEERARAKERVFSVREADGGWKPESQRPELWRMWNGRVHEGEHVRAFPISDWTELDVWTYIARERLELPPIYFAHEREVFRRDGMLLAVERVPLATGRRGAAHDLGALPHGRRHVGDGRRRVAGHHARRGGRGDRCLTAHRARRDPGRRPHLGRGHGRPQAGGVLLSEATLLRVAAAGSVDDGKSTLIGRLLLDSKQVLEDTLESVSRNGDAPNLAYLTDGLRAERERGITIDVAYRYFATAGRRFVLADTPGHEEYTRNMVTGASRADVSLILVDATRGLASQSRRHLALSAVLRVPHVLACVNKMDAVGYAEARFDEIAGEFAALPHGSDCRTCGRSRSRP